MSGARVAWLAVLCGSLGACRGGASAGDVPDAAASPQAKAEPAPLANVPTNAATTVAALTSYADSGPAPPPMRADREIASDQPSERSAKDPLVKDAARDPSHEPSLSGYSLQAVLRVSDVAGPPKAGEVSDKALEAAKKKTEPHLSIDTSQTRARIAIASSGFVMPQGTEIRARLDRYGHVLLWPHESTYRVVAPGALRALFGERRLDVAPMAGAEIAPVGDGARRFNYRTRKVEVTTRAAKATFEIASIAGAGEGGTLLCRALLDLMNAPPSTPLCQADDMPLHADLHWTTKGAIAFDVVSIVRRTDLASSQLAAPPAALAFVPSPPPPLNSETMLTRPELAAFRISPVEVPVSADVDARAPAPDSGLILVNSSDQLRFAWIDGVPVAWIAPGAREQLTALQRGRYVLQWRTFLGDAFEAPQNVTVPGMSDFGAQDAGARP